MTRLLIHVEGDTEEAFVEEVLAPHLYRFGYSNVRSRLMGKYSQRDRRGGIKPWPETRNGIVNHLREDPGSLSGIMVDYSECPKGAKRPGLAGRGHRRNFSILTELRNCWHRI